MNQLVANPFGDTERASVSAGALQQQSREVAETQTKYLMAERFPRDEVKAMDRILNAFSRPSLAERAQYQYARGGTDIVGPSIHAAQSIAQGWGNIEFGWDEVARGIGADGIPYSEVKAYATDLQSRVPRATKFIVKHWRDTKNGGYKLKDERDIYELCANMAQRRVRGCILAVVPTDVVDSAMEQAATTLSSNADTSPAAMAKMVATFGEFGVTKEMIEKRLQRRLDAITPAQVVQLKRIYVSLRDEMSSVGEWFDAPPPQASAAEAVKEALKAEPKAKERPPKPPLAEQPPMTYAQYADAMNKATGEEPAALLLDEARDVLPPDQHAELAVLFKRKFTL
jgi:hypothetical protein